MRVTDEVNFEDWFEAIVRRADNNIGFSKNDYALNYRLGQLAHSLTVAPMIRLNDKSYMVNCYRFDNADHIKAFFKRHLVMFYMARPIPYSQTGYQAYFCPMVPE